MRLADPTIRLAALLTLPLLLLCGSTETRADTLYGTAHPGGASAPSSLYRINHLNGGETLIGPVGFNAVGGMDFQPVFGTLYAVAKRPGDSTNVLITIDTVTGTGKEVGPLVNVNTAGSGGLFDLSFRNSDGTLFLSALDVETVSLYTIDLATGLATFVGDTTASSSGNGLAFSLNDILYLGSGPTLYTVDQAAGTATSGPAFNYSGFPALNNPRLTAMETRPGRGGVYTAVNDGSAGAGPNYLGVVNRFNGTVTHLGLSVNGLESLAWKPDPPVEPLGQLYGAAHPGGPSAASTLYLIDPATGSAGAIGPIGFNSVGAIDFDPTTKVLYGVGKRPADDTDVLIVINPLNGAGAEVGPLVNTSPMGNGGLYGLSWRSDGSLFLTAVNPGDSVSLFSVNPSTGVASAIGDTTAVDSGNGLGFSSDDTLFLTSGGTLYTVNTTTGLGTIGGSLGYLGFPGLSNTRLNAIDFNPISGVPFAAVNDGSAGGGPNYLAFFDILTGNVVHIGLTINGLDALAWRPTRDSCDVTIFGTAHSGGSNVPSTFYEVDPATGTAAPVGPVGFNGVGGMAFQPGTRALYAIARRPADGENVLITIDPDTGKGTEVGPLLNTGNFGGGHYDLSFRRSDGVLHMLATDTFVAMTLWTVNLQTGEATPVGITGTSNAGNGMAFSPTDTMYHVDDTDEGKLRIVDQTTGTSTASTDLSYVGFPALSLPRPNAMDFETSSGTGYISVNDGSFGLGPNYLGQVNTATGIVTHAGRTINGLDAIAVFSGCDDEQECTLDSCSTCAGLLYGSGHTGGPGGSSTFYLIDENSGATVFIGSIGFDGVGGMDFHPRTGLLYGVAKRHSDGVDVAIVIEPTSGSGTEIGPLVNTDNLGGGGHFDVSFRESDGVLFLTAFDSGGDVNLFTIDLAGGTATPVGLTGTDGAGQALGFSALDVLYHADDAGGGTLYTLNAGTGEATSVGALSYAGFPALVGPEPNSMDFDPCSAAAVVSVDDGNNGGGPNYLGSLDPVTRIVGNVGGTVRGLDALAWRPVTGRDCVNTVVGDTDSDGWCDPIDNCPKVSNPAQQAVTFGESMLATSKTTFDWTSPADIVEVEGDLALVDSYGFTGTSSIAGATGITAGGGPAPGDGLYYLVRHDCQAGSWVSGGPGECAVPGSCPAGERDGNLP